MALCRPSPPTQTARKVLILGIFHLCGNYEGRKCNKSGKCVFKAFEGSTLRENKHFMSKSF